MKRFLPLLFLIGCEAVGHSPQPTTCEWSFMTCMHEAYGAPDEITGVTEGTECSQGYAICVRDLEGADRCRNYCWATYAPTACGHECDGQP